MPYQIYVERWRSKPFVIRRKLGLGRAMGYHKTRESAEAQIAAIEKAEQRKGK